MDKQVFCGNSFNSLGDCPHEQPAGLACVLNLHPRGVDTGRTGGLRLLWCKELLCVLSILCLHCCSGGDCKDLHVTTCCSHAICSSPLSLLWPEAFFFFFFFWLAYSSGLHFIVPKCGVSAFNSRLQSFAFSSIKK